MNIQPYEYARNFKNVKGICTATKVHIWGKIKG